MVFEQKLNKYEQIQIKVNEQQEEINQCHPIISEINHPDMKIIYNNQSAKYETLISQLTKNYNNSINQLIIQDKQLQKLNDLNEKYLDLLNLYKWVLKKNYLIVNQNQNNTIEQSLNLVDMMIINTQNQKNNEQLIDSTKYFIKQLVTLKEFIENNKKQEQLELSLQEEKIFDNSEYEQLKCIRQTLEQQNFGMKKKIQQLELKLNDQILKSSNQQKQIERWIQYYKHLSSIIYMKASSIEFLQYPQFDTKGYDLPKQSMSTLKMIIDKCRSIKQRYRQIKQQSKKQRELNNIEMQARTKQISALKREIRLLSKYQANKQNIGLNECEK